MPAPAPSLPTFRAAFIGLLCASLGAATRAHGNGALRLAPPPAQRLPLGRFVVVVPGGSGGGVVEVLAGSEGSAGAEEPSSSVVDLTAVVLESGEWVSRAENEGMFKLVPGATQCESTTWSVSGASVPPGGGAVVVRGTLGGFHGHGCAAALAADGVGFSVTLTVAAESSATVALNVTVDGAAAAAAAAAVAQTGERKAGAPWRRLRLSLAADPDERVRGLGVQYSRRDFKGSIVPVITSEQGVGRGLEPLSAILGEAAGNWHTTYSAIPHFTTSTLRGVYLVGTDLCWFDFTRGTETRVVVYSPSATMRAIAASSHLGLVEEYTAWAGRLPPLPEWATAGPVVGYEGGTAAVVALHKRMVAARVKPAAYWLQDWTGQRQDVFGTRLWWNWELDEDHYPGWDQLCANLSAGTGTRLMTYMNPYLATGVTELKPNARRDLFREAASRGFLVRNATGGPYVQASGSPFFSFGTVDFTNADARAWYAGVIATNMLGRCTAGWMADFAEYLPFDAVLSDGTPDRQHNAFPALWAGVNRQATESVGKPAVYFMRSSSSRSPSQGSLFWLGDQLVTWDEFDGLRTVVNGHISAGVSGLSLVHSDLGGYTMVKQGPIKLLRTRELLVRWMELSSVTDAVFRSHPGNLPNESWQIYTDDSTLRCFARLAALHTVLRPYRVALMANATLYGHPLVRPLWMHFPSDPVAQATGTQLLFGRDVMVAPALSPGQRTVDVHVPAGVWVDPWSGAEYGSLASPTNVTLPAAAGQPPVLAVKGSAVAAQLVAGVRNLPRNTC